MIFDINHDPLLIIVLFEVAKTMFLKTGDGSLSFKHLSVHSQPFFNDPLGNARHAGKDREPSPVFMSSWNRPLIVIDWFAKKTNQCRCRSIIFEITSTCENSFAGRTDFNLLIVFFE